MSQHYVCPFGTIGSVHGWERIGAALEFLAMVLLHLALFRYVDDYFGVERHVDSTCAKLERDVIRLSFAGEERWSTR